MELNTNSQQYLTVNTQKRLYAYQRLTYGIAFTPAFFQSTMDLILQGVDNVLCRIGDIILRTDPHEYLQVLDEVLPRLERHSILAKKSKCEFMVPSVEFLGYGRRSFPRNGNSNLCHRGRRRPSAMDFAHYQSPTLLGFSLPITNLTWRLSLRVTDLWRISETPVKSEMIFPTCEKQPLDRYICMPYVSSCRFCSCNSFTVNNHLCFHFLQISGSSKHPVLSYISCPTQ